MNTKTDDIAYFTIAGHKDDNERIFVGVSDLQNGDLRAAIGAAAGVTQGTHRECKTIEFVPLYTEGHRAWLAEHPLEQEDTLDSRAEYVVSCDRSRADAEWVAGSFGDDYITMAVLFFCYTGSLYPQTPVTTSFRVTPELHAELTDALVKIHGAQNVMVSKQVLTTPAFITRHAEFTMQAQAALAEGQRYKKAVYDEQSYPALYPNMGTYCIPVTVKKTWNRVFNVEDTNKVLSEFETITTLADDFWARLALSLRRGTTVIPRLATVANIASMYSMFLVNCQKEVATEVPSPSYISRVKRFFSRGGD